MKPKILFIYNWVPKDQRKGQFGECATAETITNIREALISFGMEVISLNVLNKDQMIRVINANMPIDLAFVIAEGFLDEPTSLYDGTGALKVREVLELYEVPYTHSGVNGMEACRNKDITYQELVTKNISIPKFHVFGDGDNIESIQHSEYVVGYPMFIKPCGGGNSIGIDDKSAVYNKQQLINKLNQLKGLIGDQPVIAETYLDGREYTVGVIGNTLPLLMPIVAFPEDFAIRSHAVKKVESKERHRFEILGPGNPIGLKIQEIAFKVFEALGARDLIRIDMKQDSSGNIYVIDVNGTPSLSQHGSLAYMMESIGITHRELVALLLFTAMVRYDLPVPIILEETALKVITILKGNYDDNKVA